VCHNRHTYAKGLFYGGDCRVREINLLRALPIMIPVYMHDFVMDDGNIVSDHMTVEILEDEDLLTAHGLENP
jgi:hypothetical protein